MGIILTGSSDMFLVILLFLIGIVLIVKGGDFFVDASSWIAEKSGVPKFIIGATIVSLATTLPELLVSVLGALEENVGMSVGNAIGSVTVNTGLIMGISICFIPGVIKRKSYLPKMLILIASTALIWILSMNGTLSVLDSIFLIIILIIFIIENVYSGKNNQLTASSDSQDKENVTKIDIIEEKNYENKNNDVLLNVLKFIFGAAGIVYGAQLLIKEGTIIANALNVPQAIIGLTMVAIGTSLPELVTTITAIIKKESSLSVGNIIGANIIDICLILPVCSFIYGGAFPIDDRTRYLDMPVCLGIILVALIPTIITKKFTRLQGIIMVILYLIYAVVITAMPGLFS